jgi:hypothetical protein
VVWAGDQSDSPVPRYLQAIKHAIAADHLEGLPPRCA